MKRIPGHSGANGRKRTQSARLVLQRDSFIKRVLTLFVPSSISSILGGKGELIDFFGVDLLGVRLDGVFGVIII